MRLIDADKLKQHYSWWAFQDYDLRIQKDIFDDIVDVQPTIESRPKGKWLKDIGCFECSNCGWIITAGDEEINNYCPHCGSYMRNDNRQE